jgi:hypothetical protein
MQDRWSAETVGGLRPGEDRGSQCGSRGGYYGRETRGASRCRLRSLKGACIRNEHTLEVPKFVRNEGEVVKSVVVLSEQLKSDET